MDVASSNCGAGLVPPKSFPLSGRRAVHVRCRRMAPSRSISTFAPMAVIETGGAVIAFPVLATLATDRPSAGPVFSSGSRPGGGNMGRRAFSGTAHTATRPGDTTAPPAGPGAAGPQPRRTRPASSAVAVPTSFFRSNPDDVTASGESRGKPARAASWIWWRTHKNYYTSKGQ